MADQLHQWQQRLEQHRRQEHILQQQVYALEQREQGEQTAHKFQELSDRMVWLKQHELRQARYQRKPGMEKKCDS